MHKTHGHGCVQLSNTICCYGSDSSMTCSANVAFVSVPLHCTPRSVFWDIPQDLLYRHMCFEQSTVL